MYGCGNTNLVIWTVGHSTRSFEEFFELLAGHRIERLADVRRFPASQRVPWATKQVLAAALRDRGLDYEDFEDLGGFRRPIAGSSNTASRNASFRGSADYAASSAFGLALRRLGLPPAQPHSAT